MSQLNVDGLTPEEIKLLETLANTLRASRDREAVRESFRTRWEEWTRTAPSLSEEEVGTAIAEAIAEVRGHV
ncbi:hypothetical protein EPO34_02730 [Patescibacteria group bacterium]|nr:MAG: hypothetical protein EPO34_02730 [Patescibacteria group bacterium]